MSLKKKTHFPPSNIGPSLMHHDFPEISNNASAVPSEVLPLPRVQLIGGIWIYSEQLADLQRDFFTYLGLHVFFFAIWRLFALIANVEARQELNDSAFSLPSISIIPSTSNSKSDPSLFSSDSKHSLKLMFLQIS